MKNASYYKKKAIEIYLEDSGALEKWPKVLRPIVASAEKAKACKELRKKYQFKKQ